MMIGVEARQRRLVLVTWGAAVAVLPLLWIHHAAQGSQEFVNDDGEIRDTLLYACFVLLFWALAVGTIVRSLWRSLLVAVGGAAVALAALGGTLWWGYGRLHRTHSPIEPGFGLRMTGLALRGVALVVLGVAIGYAIRGLADRFRGRSRVGVVSVAVLALCAGTEMLGARLPRGRFQLSTYIAGWLRGELLIYRPTPECPAGPCSVYHADWRKSLPVLAGTAAVALLIGWLCRALRPPHPPGDGARADTHR